MRHELVHAWQFEEADHGETFACWTDLFDIAQRSSESLLIESGDRLPPRPDEWLTALLADTADD